MQNDEIQEDVTLENNVETVEDVIEETEDNDVEAELAKARAEAKKWEAIAKRNKEKATKAPEAAPSAPASLDQELVDLTYKNYLGGLGLTNPSVQEEAIQLAKKMGVGVSQIANDQALMEVLKTKQKIAVTNQALAKGTGGAAKRTKDVDYIASKVANGGTLTEINGDDALALIRKMKS